MASQMETQQTRLETFSKSELFQALSSSHQAFILDAAQGYRLTQQEFLQLTEMTSDLVMWGEISPQKIWQ